MKENAIRKIAIFAAAVLLLAAGLFFLIQSGLVTAEPKVEVTANNRYEETLVVITDEDYRPYSFYDSEGGFSGHDVELITLLANEMEMNLDLRFMKWNDAIAEMTAGNADILMTCDYSDSFAGVDTLNKSETTSFEEFVVYSKDRLSSADALYGKRIAVMKNGNVMSEIRKKQLTKYCLEYPDNRGAMQAVIDGEADCAVMRQTVGTVLLQELKAKDITGYTTLGLSDMCFGINSSKPELTDKINAALEKLKMRGELEKLRNKWLTTFVKPYTFPELLEKNVGVVLGFIILGAIALAAVISKQSQKMKAEEEEYRNAQVIEQLAQDFGCVNYVELTDHPETDPVINYRVSQKLNRLIPGWEKEKYFPKKLILLRDNLVYEPDREEFFENVDRKKVLEAIAQAGVHFVNVRLFFDGNILYYQMKFSPVYEGGRLKGLVAGLHSVDEQTRKELDLQEQLREALSRADAASRAKTEFLFNMSHDIRTPMNAILGYTDIGLRHVSDVDKAKDSFLKIKSSGKHLLDLINDILEMSRIESGKLELSEAPVDIREAVRDVDQMCRALAVPKSIDYETEIVDIRDPYVYSDVLHINEIVINLISNAIKYTPSGGTVRFRISQITDNTDGFATYRLEVSDNGIGMSEEFQQHLFEAFSREESAMVSKTEGAGLGLSIVKKILDLAGGRISVASRQHEGSVFTVEIPFRLLDDDAIEAYREAHRKTSEPVEKSVALEGKKVLLVEDNAMNREIATEILEEAGLSVETAEDGELALKAVLDNGVEYYDCILMDIQMPVMNGYEATKAIRSLPGGNTVPIIALSANAFEEDRKKSLRSGMNAHIPKPIDVKTLFEAMSGLIRR